LAVLCRREKQKLNSIHGSALGRESNQTIFYLHPAEDTRLKAGESASLAQNEGSEIGMRNLKLH
jgi:hypothetical protein